MIWKELTKIDQRSLEARQGSERYESDRDIGESYSGGLDERVEIAAFL